VHDTIRMLDYTVAAQNFLAVIDYVKPGDDLEQDQTKKLRMLSPGGFDGIMGMGFAAGADCAGPPVYENLARHSEDSNAKIFAFHLTNDGNRKSSITFGKFDNSLYSGELRIHDVWRPPPPNEVNRWILEVSEVTSSGNVIGTKLRAQLDTGAVAIYAHPIIVRAFYNKIPTSVEVDSGNTGYMIPCDLPGNSMVFYIGGVEYAVDPRYLVDSEVEGHDGFCWGSVTALDGIPLSLMILGGPFLKTWYSVFNAHSLSVGLAKAT